MNLAISSIILTTMVSFFIIQDVANTDESTEAQRPVELGTVHWQRDLDAARKQSASSDKPILVLFQEVPGCQTCQDFGNSPMSHPLLVEAIEDLFIPVLVYNNKPADETTLKKFNEPSWNNPVIRYLDADAKDLIARKENVWSTEATATRMIAALNSAKKPVPHYLSLVAESSRKTKTETAEFAMHCYWEGEAKLGSISGVHKTQSGWRNNLEVVQIEFDPLVVDYEKLLATAQSFECASKVFTHNDRQQSVAANAVGDDAISVDKKMKTAKPSDQKYYVRNSVYAHLALTSLQSTKINAALYQKKSPRQWLSPRQLHTLGLITAAKQNDEHAFADLVWPDDDSKLVEFHNRLNGEFDPSMKND